MLQYLDTIIAFAVVMLGFSLLITILNQTISAFLSFRGSNLRWGIKTMLTTLDPNALGQQAEEIADRILTQPIISDSILTKWDLKKVPILGMILGPVIERWKLASAIGPDTLVRTLTKVSQDMRDENIANHQTTAQAPQPNQTIPDAIDLLLLEIDPQAARKLQMLHAAFDALTPGYAVQVDDFLAQMGSSAQQSVGRIEAWFNIAMNRVSQRFTMQIRIWTVIFAFILAFGVHVDSFNVFNQLLTNPTLRQNAINQTEAMLKEADAVLGTAAPGQQTREASDMTISPKVLGDKLKELIDKDIDKQKEGTPALLGTIPGFQTLAQAEKWLRDNLNQDVKPDRKEQLVTKYKGYVIVGLRDQGKRITDLLQKTGLELVPGDRTLPSFGDLAGWIKFFFHFDGSRNFLGVLFTACMLALGAPFWYNMLKSLTNLRPMLATRQDQQKKDAAAG